MPGIQSLDGRARTRPVSTCILTHKSPGASANPKTRALFIITLIGVIVQECCGGRRKREQASTATQMATTTYVPKGDYEYQVTPASPMRSPTHQYQQQQSYFGQQQQNYGGEYTSAGTPVYSTPVITPGPYEENRQTPPSHQYPRKSIQSKGHSRGYLPFQRTRGPQSVQYSQV